MDGYIAGASGNVYDSYDYSTNGTNATSLASFITNSFGNFTINVPNLPDVYTVVLRGGTDIATNKLRTSVLAGIYTKTTSSGSENTLADLNITPISTILTSMVVPTDGVISIANVATSTAKIVEVLGITEADLKSDYIAVQSTSVAKLVQQVEVMSSTLASAINNSDVSTDTIMKSIAKTIASVVVNTGSQTTFSLADTTSITSIIAQVAAEKPNVVISESVKTNSASFISSTNTTIDSISETDSFETVFTQAVKISVASVEIAKSPTSNFETTVAAPTQAQINNVSVGTVNSVQSVANDSSLLGSGIGHLLPVGSFTSVVTTQPIDVNIDYQIIHTADYDYNSLTEDSKNGIKDGTKYHYSSKLNISATRIGVTLSSGSTIITVHIFSPSYSQSSPPSVAPICFPKGTPVTTNQGLVAIENLNPDIHTIRNKRIVAITQTRPLFKHIVSIEKDALGKNVPSATTQISKEHGIFYKGKMMRAIDLVNVCKGVTKIPYTGETLYNVLMEKYGYMMINNLICETLHPDNIMAKICGGKYNSSEQYKICEILTKIIKANNLPAYKKLYASLK